MLTNIPDNGSEYTATVTPKKERKAKASLAVLHCDIIGDEFWTETPYILAG